MRQWERIPAINSVLEEINLVGPARAKAADGTIGDQAHMAAGTSDHIPDEQSSALKDRDGDSVNEVHAVDVDTAGPWAPGWSPYRITRTLADWQRAGRNESLQNIIYNGLIASRSWGWTWKVYDGADNHRAHFHISFRYGSGKGDSNPENSDGPWGISAALEQEEDVDVSAFFESVGRAVKGEGADASDRANRDNFARAVRFAWGLNAEEQTGENMPDHVIRGIAKDVKDVLAGAKTDTPPPPPPAAKSK